MSVDRKQFHKNIERFRAEWYKRIRNSHGNVDIAAASCLVTPNTVSRWGTQPGYSLPDFVQMHQMACALGFSPAWLAWGLGARDPELAAEQEIYSARLEQWPGFRQMIEQYSYLDEDKRKVVRDLVAQLPPARQERFPPGSDREPKGQAAALMTPAYRFPYPVIPDKKTPSAKPPGEWAEIQGFTPVPHRKRKPINRRNELAVYTQCTQNQAYRKTPIPHYIGIAAGPDRALEESTDVVWVREYYPDSGVVSGRVATDSMAQTVVPGDIILMQPYNGGEGLALPSIGENDPKTPLSHLRVQVPAGEIYLVSLNGGDPFLKRIRYDTRGGNATDWRLVIEADNADAWDSYPTRKTDDVIFFARVIGLLKRNT